MEPKKYIRTLAGDIETLKKGGAPDLAPIIDVPSPPVVEGSALPPTQIPSSNIGHVLDAPLSIPVSRIEPVPIEVHAPEPIHDSLETYASDFSDHMKNTNASPATVLAAEQDATSGAPRQAESKPSPNALYVFAGILLLIAGGWGIYAAYSNKESALPPDVFTLAASAPILVEDEEQISGTGVVLSQAIEKSVNRKLASGTVRLLSIANTDTSIFSALQFPAPNVFLRNLNVAGNMAGVINMNTSQSPFFILSVASYGETFSGMLSWEPQMPHDLARLFPPYAVSVAPPATTTATSSPSIATTAGFHDEVINNHDARVYRDAQMRSVLLYGYWTQKTLIIVRDPAAFIEILNRLASAHTQP